MRMFDSEVIDCRDIHGDRYSNVVPISRLNGMILIEIKIEIILTTDLKIKNYLILILIMILMVQLSLKSNTIWNSIMGPKSKPKSDIADI